MTANALLLLRRTAATGSLLLFTAAFAGITWAPVAFLLEEGIHWQLGPALATLIAGGGSLAVVTVLLTVTLLAGRVLCSTWCPLGVLQDVIARLRNPRIHRWRYRTTPRRLALRLSILALFGGSLLAGPVSWALAVGDPATQFGRVVSLLARPAWAAALSLRQDSAERHAPAAPGWETWIAGGSVLIPSAFLVGLAWLAATRGRRYCQTFCPIGTLLGSLSPLAAFRVEIDSSRCSRCGLCVRTCRSGCIELDNTEVDPTRCVTCLHCTVRCPKGAIALRYRWRWPFGKPARAVPASASTVPNPADAPAELRRRSFLVGTLTAASTLAAVPLRAQLGAVSFPFGDDLNPIPIMPPGAGSLHLYLSRCTACMRCVSACPSQLLVPSTKEFGWTHLLTPRVQFSRGHCRPDCTLCTQVCPTGALAHLSVEQKRLTRMGVAVLAPDLCVVNAAGRHCTRCASHCPTEAISHPQRNGRRGAPRIDRERCIGCGACVQACRARPMRALRVVGLTTQETLPNWAGATDGGNQKEPQQSRRL